MLDFETVKLRAPYRVALPQRDGDLVEQEVEDVFEATVRCIPRSDTTPVATMLRRHNDSTPETWDFVDIEGRLFRQFDFMSWAVHWTSAEWNKEPPVIELSEDRQISPGHRTSLLGSPFRSSFLESTPWLRRRARKAAPEAYEATRYRVEALAADKLRIIDGVLFQEARAPAWSVSQRGGRLTVVLPDHDNKFDSLVDGSLQARPTAGNEAFPRHSGHGMGRTAAATDLDQVTVDFSPAIASAPGSASGRRGGLPRSRLGIRPPRPESAPWLQRGPGFGAIS